MRNAMGALAKQAKYDVRNSLYILTYISNWFDMASQTVNIGNPLGKYYMFYSAQASLLNHNIDREFGTVIAEGKNELIIVDDENIREHVYLIPKSKVDHWGEKKVYFDIPESSLKEFEF